MQIKLTIIRLRNENQSRTLEKPIISIINKKEKKGELSFVKRPSKLKKTTVVVDQRIQWRKPPLTMAQQTKNIPGSKCQYVPYIEDYTSKTLQDANQNAPKRAPRLVESWDKK